VVGVSRPDEERRDGGYAVDRHHAIVNGRHGGEGY
jgi:hypothetical protein